MSFWDLLLKMGIVTPQSQTKFTSAYERDQAMRNLEKQRK